MNNPFHDDRYAFMHIQKVDIAGLDPEKRLYVFSEAKVLEEMEKKPSENGMVRSFEEVILGFGTCHTDYIDCVIDEEHPESESTKPFHEVYSEEELKRFVGSQPWEDDITAFMGVSRAKDYQD